MSHQPCYMCDRPGTSKEHVPPRCLFPETRDAGGNHRRNLITVPSCEEHNSRKSADDEFLMVSLAGIIGNNSIGYRHKCSKVNRAIYRSSFALLDQAMANRQVHAVEIAPNKFLDVICGTPDQDRLKVCFDRIARGLFYNLFGSKFRGRCKSILGYLKSDSANATEFQRLVRDKVRSELGDKPRVGDNPAVFSFQFTDLDAFGLRLLHTQFYGGLDVYTAFLPDNTELPFDLGIELMNRGIRTTFEIGAEKYHFNADESDNANVE